MAKQLFDNFDTLEVEKEGEIIWVTFKLIYFNKNVIREINMVLDIALGFPKEDPLAIVFRSNRKNLFSAGLELQVLIGDIYILGKLIGNFGRLIGRLLGFSIPTIGMINGHCIAGGLMFAMALDYRVMLKGNFKIEMNEISFGLDIPRFMIPSILAKLCDRDKRDLCLFGISLDQNRCLEGKIIDQLADNVDQLKELARSKAIQMAKSGIGRLAYKISKSANYRKYIKMARETLQFQSALTLRDNGPKL